MSNLRHSNQADSCKRRDSVYSHCQCIMKYNNIRLDYVRTRCTRRSVMDEATAVVTKTQYS